MQTRRAIKLRSGEIPPHAATMHRIPGRVPCTKGEGRNVGQRGEGFRSALAKLVSISRRNSDRVIHQGYVFVERLTGPAARTTIVLMRSWGQALTEGEASIVGGSGFNDEARRTSKVG
jgi:hypothetical protein